jgi:ubiquinone/menaquinone biosynthesis C-methylase UbiE
MTDAAAFREAQHASWDSVAAGWQQWSEFAERAYAPISERLVELAGVQPGDRVLDVAAGYGEPSLTAARAVGPGGMVVATDISPEMLAFGRERAAAAQLDNVEFVEANATSIDLPAASFDAAVSRWGIIFEPEAEQAAARVRSLLKPDSRFAISSWGTPAEVPFLSLPMRVVRELFDAPAPPPDLPGPLSRPTEQALADLLGEAGFTTVEVERAEVVFDFDSADHFTAYARAIAAPVRALIEQHAPADPDAAWEAITRAATALAGDDGRVRMTNAVLLATGRA